jgi:hypothetical protein
VRLRKSESRLTASRSKLTSIQAFLPALISPQAQSVLSFRYESIKDLSEGCSHFLFKHCLQLMTQQDVGKGRSRAPTSNEKSVILPLDRVTIRVVSRLASATAWCQSLVRSRSLWLHTIHKAIFLTGTRGCIHRLSYNSPHGLDSNHQ